MPTKTKKSASNARRAKPEESASPQQTPSPNEQNPATLPAAVGGPPQEPAVAPVERTSRKSPYYRTIFMSAASGFELGEDRRFKQRVFLFKEKPDEVVLNALKENGFTYRPSEKAWTIRADYTSRTVSDKLARQFADGAGLER